MDLVVAVMAIPFLIGTVSLIWGVTSLLHDVWRSHHPSPEMVERLIVPFPGPAGSIADEARRWLDGQV